MGVMKSMNVKGMLGNKGSGFQVTKMFFDATAIVDATNKTTRNASTLANMCHDHSRLST